MVAVCEGGVLLASSQIFRVGGLAANGIFAVPDKIRRGSLRPAWGIDLEMGSEGFATGYWIPLRINEISFRRKVLIASCSV
ncbi:hypothetical protein DSO57_1022181 [Entomophthora muscae]|uniref:Uncharacterized protein n=1 Tax=Entomophthora muscae TaxID=34485 RepID=A0ACC2TRL9_9FUNG|nr:hypothetical protein DSO57_1022181 [Entomophthora muscae]